MDLMELPLEVRALFDIHASVTLTDGICKTNFSLAAGHIYIPSLEQCLGVPESGSAPYELVPSPCYFSDDSGSIFTNFVSEADGTISFVRGSVVSVPFRRHKLLNIFHSFGCAPYRTQKDTGSIDPATCASGFFGVLDFLTDGPAAVHCTSEPRIIGLKI